MITGYKTEIRTFILYDFLLNHSVGEAISNNSKLPEQYRVSHHSIRRWYAKFEKGDFSLKENNRPGRPVIVEQLKVRELALSDPSLTQGEIAKIAGCSKTSVSRYLSTLNSEMKNSQVNRHLNLILSRDEL